MMAMPALKSENIGILLCPLLSLLFHTEDLTSMMMETTVFQIVLHVVCTSRTQRDYIAESLFENADIVTPRSWTVGWSHLPGEDEGDFCCWC